MIVYEVLYMEDVFHTNIETISVHKTKEAAEKALKKHKSRIETMFINEKRGYDWNKWWGIRSLIVVE